MKYAVVLLISIRYTVAFAELKMKGQDELEHS